MKEAAIIESRYKIWWLARGVVVGLSLLYRAVVYRVTGSRMTTVPFCVIPYAVQATDRYRAKRREESERLSGSFVVASRGSFGFTVTIDDWTELRRTTPVLGVVSTYRSINNLNNGEAKTIPRRATLDLFANVSRCTERVHTYRESTHVAQKLRYCRGRAVATRCYDYSTAQRGNGAWGNNPRSSISYWL